MAYKVMNIVGKNNKVTSRLLANGKMRVTITGTDHGLESVLHVYTLSVAEAIGHALLDLAQQERTKRSNARARKKSITKM